MKILLVEDSRVLRLSNERALIKAGYKVITAEDGESALQCAKEQKPDLILLDLLLPKVSGLEVLTRLKHNRATAQIPVVAVSGLSEKNRQRLIEAGAEDYLEKEFGHQRQRHESPAPGAGRSYLPYQPQTRHQLLASPRQEVNGKS